MKSLHRITFISLILGALCAGWSVLSAYPGKPIAFQACVLLALLWLMLIGWGFQALLRRYLAFQDRLAAKDTELQQERGARATAERALDDAHSALSRLIHGQEAVRETERQRIARDIHDDLGQNLLALKIELSLLPNNPALGRIAANLDLTIRSLRTIINDLRPLALEDGLQNAIEWQLSEFSRINNIRHHLEADPHAFQALPNQHIDATLYRILQESLSNVVRHAQATEVKIALSRSADQLLLKVQDNGIGMTGQPAPGRCGLGSMEERVTALGGKLQIDSQPGAGTVISLSIPIGT